ncbi:MAG TPA: hypothetical protein DG761_07110 [Gammaproteobacteria bacterium]|nr:hypothetical protein [Gammaproteobacteria bacterium]
MADAFVAEFALWGAFGGLISVLAKDGRFEFPRVQDRYLYLGSLSGVLFGMVAGLIGDDCPPNAFVWGIGGATVVQGFCRLADTKAKSLFGKGGD